MRCPACLLRGCCSRGARQDAEQRGEWMLHADRLLGVCTESNHAIVPFQHRRVLDAITAVFTTANVDLKTTNTIENERQMNGK